MEVQDLRRNAHFYSEVLESHEPTFARQKKRYWREPLTDSASLLDIRMSELLDSDVKKNSETARASLSGTHLYKEPLDAERIGDPRSSLIGCNLCGVARKYPQSEGGCNSTLLNVGNDIFGETLRHQERGSSGEYSVEL